MPKRYSIAEARSNLPDIVNQAAAGYSRFREQYALEEVGLEDDCFAFIRGRNAGREVLL